MLSSRIDGHAQDVMPYPLHYQVSLLESSIILPTSSSSADLVALESECVVLTNSYHAQSWVSPNVTNQEVSESSDDNISVEYCFPSREEMGNGHPPSDPFVKNPDDQTNRPRTESYSRRSKFKSKSQTSSFDKSLLLRLNISAEAIRIYTAISREHFNLDFNDMEASVSLMTFMKISNVTNGDVHTTNMQYNKEVYIWWRL